MSSEFSFQELLSPFDFEILVRDLLSCDLGIDFRTFAEGPDQGIDLRYAADPDGMTIVQCKRRKDLSQEQLQLEAEKVEKLAPAKYYLATSNDLSVGKCDQILVIFAKWMNDDGHIYDKGRLNRTLQKYPNILRQNYKLWISSSDIFDQFINNDLLGRSTFLVGEIRKSLKYYVTNEGYRQAVDILNHSNAVIISGIPGIGKTTMARLLVWNYLQEGFDVAEIRSVIDGERILKTDNRKQVLYFDDFLGENFLQSDVLQGRSNDLYMFIQRFISNEVKNKKLILTTREYILNQAKERYDKLDRREIDTAKYIVDLAKYSNYDKAMILYNHLYYSNITGDHIRAILKDDIYKKIINHPNYSPRIIESMTINLIDVPPENYAAEFLADLGNPTRVWERAFESQISEYSRYLLYTLASLESTTYMIYLEIAFQLFCNELGLGPDLRLKPHTFRNCLKEIEGTFIQITVTKNNVHRVAFINPSVKDFLNGKLVANSHIVKGLVLSSIFLNQLLFLYEHTISQYIPRLTAIVVERLIKHWAHFRS